MSPPLCFGDAREGAVGDSTPPHPLDRTSRSQLKLIKQKGTLSSTQEINLMIIPTLARGCWLYVEWGSSASGRRRSLRYEVRALNLPQVRNLQEVGDNRLQESVGPTHRSATTTY